MFNKKNFIYEYLALESHNSPTFKLETNGNNKTVMKVKRIIYLQLKKEKERKRIQSFFYKQLLGFQPSFFLKIDRMQSISSVIDVLSSCVVYRCI